MQFAWRFFRHGIVFVIPALSLCLTLACATSHRSARWPSFPPEVIEAGRSSSVMTYQRIEAYYARQVQDREAQASTRPAPPPPTYANVLENIRCLHDFQNAAAHEAAVGAFESWGGQAIEPLLQMLKEDSLGLTELELVAARLIPLGTTEHDYKVRSPIESRPLTPDAGRIADAVIGFMQKHPDTEVMLHADIVPLDRLPVLVKLIESSTGKHQGRYIAIFCALTYTSFPRMQEVFCGNSSADEIKKTLEDGEKAQAQSAIEIKQWWAKHGHESIAQWEQAGLERYLKMESDSLKQSSANPLPSAREYDIRQYSGADGYGPSIYTVLVEQFVSAEPAMQPRILVMIASTGHGEAADFVASQLTSHDPNVQHTALYGLDVMGAIPSHVAVVRAAMQPGMTTDIYVFALELLATAIGPDALPDMAKTLDRPEATLQDAAIEGIADRAADHPELLEPILGQRPEAAAKIKHQITANRRIRQMSEGAEFTSTQPADVEKLREILKSNDDRVVVPAIHTLKRQEYVELVPDLLELIRSGDQQVKQPALEAVMNLGIPMPALDNLDSIVDLPDGLDQVMASFAYQRYGRRALPVVARIARHRRSSTYNGVTMRSSPPPDLYAILLWEKVAGIEAEITKLVRETKNLALLKLLNPNLQAKLAGELLHLEDGLGAIPIIQLMREQKMTQFSDAMFDLSRRWPDQKVLATLLQQYQNGTWDHMQYNLLCRRELDRPRLVLEATLALLAFHDVRAWEPAIQYLREVQYEQPANLLSPACLPVNVGFWLSQFGTPDRARLLLEHELIAAPNKRSVLALITALVINPRPVDADVLFAAAASHDTDSPTHILAAVALSKLSDRRALPILQDLAREAMKNKLAGSYVGEWLVETNVLPVNIGHRQRLNMIPAIIGASRLNSDPVDIGAALRRLDDTSMVDEALGSLINERGDLNDPAYAVLAGLVGDRAYSMAKQKLGSINPSLQNYLIIKAIWTGGFTREEGIGFIRGGHHLAPATLLQLAIELNLPEVADHLADLYAQIGPDMKLNEGRHILDMLCALNDQRGIDLALPDPLLFLERLEYLPDAPVRDSISPRFKYNRVEVGMVLQKWYRDHRSQLHWSTATQEFHLEKVG